MSDIARRPVISASGLTVAYGGNLVLDSIDLTIEARETVVLLGPNGAGKTTFIRCCTGLARPDSGQLSVVGHPPGSPAALERIGLMPQATGAWSAIRAEELLRYLARLYANPHSVDELIELLGISRFAKTPYRRLSGGQQQAVNLAGALIGRPELVFLDEPTAGLDPRARRLTWQIIAGLRTAGAAVLLTTHDMREAAELADYVYIVDRGRVQVSGSVAELAPSGDLEDAYLKHTSETSA